MNPLTQAKFRLHSLVRHLKLPNSCRARWGATATSTTGNRKDRRDIRGSAESIKPRCPDGMIYNRGAEHKREGRSMKRPPQPGFEQDVFTRWRRVTGYLHRAGVCKAAKRQWNRRERRASRIHTTPTSTHTIPYQGDTYHTHTIPGDQHPIEQRSSTANE